MTLYDLDLTRGLKSYKIPLNCIKAEDQVLSVLVTCDIDLSRVPLGTYLISKFNYTNITYISNTFIKIKEIDIKKISEIKLDKIECMKQYGCIKEYGLDTNPVRFHFTQGVEYKKLVAIKIEDKNKNEYKVKFGSCVPDMDYYVLNHIVYCNPDIKYKAGAYKVIYVQYENELILPSTEEIFLNIAEDNLALKYAYQAHGRKECAGKLNSIFFYFKEDSSNGIYLSKIFFTNLKTKKVYEPRFEFPYEPENSGGYYIELIFDFFGMPPGKYYIDYVYKNKLIKNQVVFELEQCKPIDYSYLYEN